MPTAIEFNHVGKQYRLGLVSTGTLSHDLNRWWQTSVLGKEDPYLKVGSVNDRTKAADSEYVWALRDIDFKVEQGDVVGIIGKNGAGKSTLLKLLSKVTAPTVGTIRARGRIASLLEVGTGFHGEMTGRENIYLNGAIMGMTREEITRKLDEIVDFSGCERYLDTPVKRYSSGMTVRLGFAVAAHLDPEILVVDEVLAVGDAEFQKKAIGKMQDISHSHGRTVLFVSHNMNSIQKLCKRGLLLENGMISYHGNIEETIDKYLSLQDIRSQIPVSNIKERNGNGLCRFSDIRFMTPTGEQRTSFKVGEEVLIKVYLERIDALSKVSRSRIDIGINDRFDVRATWLSTFMFNDRVVLDCENAVTFRIPKLFLSEGDYNINLFLEIDNMVSDWVKNVAVLHVEFCDFYGSGRSLSGYQGNFVTDFQVL
ncbi:MAG: ABC transporter ATP-binding protein [Paludibacteraceae bacterium]|nr:ABC transporter ATP-binding protein [Paludibacteraceae bacterium]